MSAPTWAPLINLAKAAQTRDLAEMGIAQHKAESIRQRIARLDAQILAEGHLGVETAPTLGALTDRWRQTTLLKRAAMEQELTDATIEIARCRAVAKRSTARLEALKLLQRRDAKAARQLADRRAEAQMIR
ncbi:MAG: hypothetical protein AAGC81_03230 [Pseudomonadota bacterium]